VEKTPSLLDRFKAVNVNGVNLQNEANALQNRLAQIQQGLAECQGAGKMLVDIDPTLPDQYQKFVEAEAKKAQQAAEKKA
jgi:hypothetical protein